MRTEILAVRIGQGDEEKMECLESQAGVNRFTFQRKNTEYTLVYPT